VDAARRVLLVVYPVVHMPRDSLNVPFSIMRVFFGNAALLHFSAVRVAPGRMMPFVELFTEPIGIAGRKLHSAEQ
jgi:hypothetical protein